MYIKQNLTFPASLITEIAHYLFFRPRQVLGINEWNPLAKINSGWRCLVPTR